MASLELVFLGEVGLLGGVLAEVGVVVIGGASGLAVSFEAGDKLCARLRLSLLLLLLLLLLVLSCVAGSICDGERVVKGGECFLGEGEFAVAAPGLVVPANCLNRCE